MRSVPVRQVLDDDLSGNRTRQSRKAAALPGHLRSRRVQPIVEGAGLTLRQQTTRKCDKVSLSSVQNRFSLASGMPGQTGYHYNCIVLPTGP
jgi:hypothetical protein